MNVKLESLRYDLDSSELFEVMVESEGHCYAELFHNNFAGAIGKAPTLIVVLLKRLPCELQISRSNLMYFGETVTEESLAEM